MSGYGKILYSADQGIARIKLNRPDKRNALDEELVTELRDALGRSARDEAVRVVLVGGAGKDFCAGADLAALEKISQASVAENFEDARHLGDLFLEMRRHPRPIVAAVRGRALAGGCGLATAADITLAAESAQFGYPEVKIGFVPAMVMAIVRRSVPEKRAFELLASGAAISARDALELGLVNRVFADASFETDVEAYVAELAGKSASAIALTKSLLYQIDAMPFEAALSAGVNVNTLARLTDDCRRGIERFLKKS
ncbi:MAG TPA: enoyl-CoA hydratase/isomerase family protein [Bryobacteraceae bacterium]|nr:enoyl-CoA hydratase/isomerase family protein [Bryobacteraceae bacterium]